MGSVWRAHDERTGRHVAVKVLGHHSSALLARFVREQAVRVRHPHVVAPTGWAAEDDLVVLAMDLVAGGSVADLLREHGPARRRVWSPCCSSSCCSGWPPSTGPAWCTATSSRPTSSSRPPGRARPHLRLGDFGVAAPIADRRFTTVPGAIGTDGYMAPEQARGAPPDPRQDLYAVGRVALELVTGQPPARQGDDPVPPAAPARRAAPRRRPRASASPRAEAALRLLRRLDVAPRARATGPRPARTGARPTAYVLGAGRASVRRLGRRGRRSLVLLGVVVGCLCRAPRVDAHDVTHRGPHRRPRRPDRPDRRGAGAARRRSCSSSSATRRATRAPRSATPAAPRALRDDAEEAGIDLYVHAPYIVNVATTNNRIRIPSRKLLQQHMDAAAEIGAKGLIVHGGHVNKTDDPTGRLRQLAQGVEATDLKIPLLIENTAGGDNAMARHLDRIAGVWDAICAADGSRRVGFCLDTCHAWAGGIDARRRRRRGPRHHRSDRPGPRQRLAATTSTPAPTATPTSGRDNCRPTSSRPWCARPAPRSSARPRVGAPSTSPTSPGCASGSERDGLRRAGSRRPRRCCGRPCRPSPRR